MAKHVEIARFSSAGKTFFFNKGIASNGNEYLAINTMYGRGSKERVVLFSSHYFDFWKALAKSITELTGFEPGAQRIAQKCPECDAESAQWGVIEHPNGEDFLIACRRCRGVVFENVPGVLAAVTEEEEDD